MTKKKNNGSPLRVAQADQSRFVVSAFCKREGLNLRVLNESQHWIVTGAGKEGSIRVEWWPSTAKAVRGTSDDRFRRKAHVVSVEQFIDLIQQELEANGQRAELPPQPTVKAVPTNWNTPSTWKNDAPVDVEPRYVKVEVAQYCRLLVVESRYKILCRFAFGLVVLLLCVVGYLFDVLWSARS